MRLIEDTSNRMCQPRARVIAGAIQANLRLGASLRAP